MFGKCCMGVVLLSTFFGASQSLAKVDDFWVWQPEPGGIKYLIPKRPGENPSKFVQNYMRNLRSSRVYGTMENAQFVRLSSAPNTFSTLPPSSREHPNVQVVLNKPDQMVDGVRRMQTDSGSGVSAMTTVNRPYAKTAISSFEKEGPRLYAIPAGLETVMNPQDMNQWRKKLNSMDGQFGVGGDDAHPRTWGQADASQALGDISVERDLAQTAYMKEYLANGKGRVFYVCGSFQRAAIADGHGFHADIEHLGAGPQRGVAGPILLEVVAEPGSEVAIAADSNRFVTSNYHHAAVDAVQPQSGRMPSSTITAYGVNPDGSRGPIVKSITFKDNAGFGTQFHPEFRGSPEEANIVKYVATGWGMRGRYSPSAVVKCMERSLSKMSNFESGGSGVAP